MAERTGAPVVPVLIIGAEETHINLGQVKILNQLLPLPLNAFPLPAKWKIIFRPPLSFTPGAGNPRAEKRAALAASGVRREMQVALRKELAQRKYVYLENLL